MRTSGGGTKSNSSCQHRTSTIGVALCCLRPRLQSNWVSCTSSPLQIHASSSNQDDCQRTFGSLQWQTRAEAEESARSANLSSAQSSLSLSGRHRRRCFRPARANLTRAPSLAPIELGPRRADVVQSHYCKERGWAAMSGDGASLSVSSMGEFPSRYIHTANNRKFT